MAGKSLLHQFGWHAGKYEIAKSAALKPKIMEGSFRKQGSSDNEPPTKKRRTEDDEDPWGDDSIEFTQADLHDIDDLELQASQAVTQRPEQIGPGSRGAVQPESRLTGTFAKPQYSRSLSSASSGTRGGNRSFSNNSSHSSNQSHSSSNSTVLSHSSNSSYPSSLSHYSSSSSTSVKSGSSVENIQGQSGSLSIGSLATNDSLRNQSTASEVARIKSECAALKIQLDTMRQDVCEKEGENKLLRDNLNKLEGELDVMKTEKISQIYQQNLQQTEKEKQLQAELTKLQTQLQFKEQEERELKIRCRDLETQLRNLQTGALSSSQAFPQPSGSVSPKPRKILVEEKSPKGSGGFPSKKTFMAAEGSPQKAGSKVTQAGDNLIEQKGSASKPGLKLAIERKRCQVKLQVNSGSRCGVQVVNKLLRLPPSMSGTTSERGIVGLLNTPSTSSTLYDVQFDRDKDTSLLSPVKSKRISDFHSLVSQLDKPELLSLVPVDHFNMAIQGLCSLLQSSQNISSDWSEKNMQNQQASANKDSDLLLQWQTNLDSAVLILPLISDYLKHYIEMLETTVNTSGSSTASASLSSPDSFDTSSESPTGSLGLFLKNTANLANELESLVVASLNTLLVLVSCDSVRRVLLESDQLQLTEQTQAGLQPKETEASSVVADLPSDAAVSRLGPHIPEKYVVKLNILRKVLKLANPGIKEGLCNAGIVATCLDILTVLASHCDEQHIPSLLPVLREEILQNCLDHEGDVAIVTHGLQLFKSLVKSNQVVTSLCSNGTDCILTTMYSLCTTERWRKATVTSQLHIASLLLESVLYMASCHKGCFTLILESDCQCSVSAVKGIVTMLHNVMKVFKKYRSKRLHIWKRNGENVMLTCEDSLLKQEMVHIRTSQTVLQTGLQLLHLIYQFDSGFVNRHTPVQHKYVQLICGLTHIFKHMDNNDNEMNALQDLWDFNQDDSELSQESDSDEQETMDT